MENKEILKRNGHKVLSDSTLCDMTKSSLIDTIRCLENNWSSALEMNENQYNILIKQDAYRWHNIKENPNDVPEFFKRVLCCIDCGDGEYEYEISHYGIYSPFNPNTCKIWALMNVVAWKEIEPFDLENIEIDCAKEQTVCEWHDLKKNPNDFPKEHICDDGYVEPSKAVLVKTGLNKYMVSRYWGHRRSKGTLGELEIPNWMDIDPSYDEYIIAWKEIT